MVEIKVGEGATEEEASRLKVLIGDGVFVSDGGGEVAETKRGFEMERGKRIRDYAT